MTSPPDYVEGAAGLVSAGAPRRLRLRQRRARVLRPAHRLSRLERRHRAGIEPDFGELQDLFETKAFIERVVGDEPEATPPAVARCPIPGCESGVVRPGVPSGRLLCDRHASEAEMLLGAKP